MRRRIAIAGFVAAAALLAQQQPQPPPATPRRLLYVTHSAGFVHGSIAVSRRVIEEAGRRGGFDVVATEDLALLAAPSLAAFDAVFFFTSGELALTAAQKQDLLAFVRSGKGFGGVHSATDTLYQWPEYGDLIGAYFDGHPWVHEAGLDVEDPDHPATRGLPASFRMVEEFYQFRAFSRDRVRVLLTLDPRTINLRAEGVHRTDEDFALAWTRPYGEGRVFYTALGHFDETWLDPRFQRILDGALRWILRLEDGDGAPRRSTPAAARISNLAYETAGVIAPALLVSIAGAGLTTGSTMQAAALPLPERLAGTQVRVNGIPAGLISVAPDRIVAMIPPEAKPGETVPLDVFTGGPQSSARAEARVESAAPGILGIARTGAVIAIYATGVAGDGEALAAGRRLDIDYFGAAPGLAGIQQINARLPADLPSPYTVLLRSGGRDSNTMAGPP